MPLPGRPNMRLVVIDDSSGAPVIDAFETFPSRKVDLATQLLELAETVRSRLRGLSVDKAVVRRADWYHGGSNKEGPKIRLLSEGAVASAARSVVVETRIGTGKETGAMFGSSKKDLDLASLALLQTQGIDVKFTEATSAGLSATRL
jgi:hypothetical protein